MIRSMTAFVRHEQSDDWGRLTLELRSVNHRYLDISPRLPEELRALEPRLRERIAAVLSRGKVDCNLRYTPPEGGAAEFTINRELATHVAQASREVDALIYNPAPISSLELMQWPGVLSTPEVSREALQAAALALLEETLEELVAQREREGEALRVLLEQRCAAMVEVVERVRERLPAVRERYRARLLERLGELRNELDAGRLEQEIVLFAQKIDVDEELDRLATHLTEVRRVVTQQQPVGRRLDFLMQELNREANTLASKSADSETTSAAVDLKVYIEQMREQVQNIE